MGDTEKYKMCQPVDHILNCCFHCSTDTPELHKISALLRTVQHAVTPTKLLPAPKARRVRKSLRLRIFIRQRKRNYRMVTQ